MKRVDIIPSKSHMHRYIICSALAGQEIEIRGSLSEDIKATKRCMDALMKVQGDECVDLFCGESGTTLRFLLPLVGSLGKKAVFYMEGRLSKRPLKPLDQELIRHGMSISYGDNKCWAEGKLRTGDYCLPGNISSQFISGILLAMPFINEEGSDLNSRLIVSGPIESAPYVNMTIKTLSDFGIRVDRNTQEDSCNTKTIFTLEDPAEYRSPGSYEVEGDWSNAAYWLLAGLIGKEPICISGLSMDTDQGDAAVVDILRGMGGKIDIYPSKEGKTDVIAYPSPLKGCLIDVSATPDLAPPLALALCLAEGEGKITGGARLRLKESDRLYTIAESLTDLGAQIEEVGDELITTGSDILADKKLEGGKTSSFGDHRIGMTAAIASLACKKPVILMKSKSIAKSYPSFIDELTKNGLASNLEAL